MSGRNKLVLGAVAALVVILFAVFALRTPPARPAPLPNPNGYADITTAAQMLKGDSKDYEQLDSQELTALVQANAAALKLIRTGLGRECRVPLTNSVDASRLEQFSDLRRAALALSAEARLAQIQQRPAEAAATAFDNVRLGQAITRGGVMIDALVGTAVERMGLNAFEKILPELAVADCRRFAVLLEEQDRSRVPVEAVLEQEKDWGRKTFGFKYRVLALLTQKSLQASQRAFAKKRNEEVAHCRKLLIRTASRAFELEKGRAPSGFDELVPEYLKAVPQDPFTGKDFAFEAGSDR